MFVSSTATTSFFLIFWAWSVSDVLRTDHRFVRYGPKFCWLSFVAILPIVGAGAWLLFGRPFVPVRPDPVSNEPVIAPEDTDAWLAYIGKS